MNKSPGCDGISVELYKTFWPNIKTLLLNTLNDAYHSGELSPTQKRSVLSLTYKKTDKALLTNWRPISLLNTDYKILAHVRRLIWVYTVYKGLIYGTQIARAYI